MQEAFSQYTAADKAVFVDQLKKAIEQANNLGVDPETTAKVKELRQKIADESVDVVALETEVYDHLYSFFRRYYEDGDFLAKRVYKPGVYAVPYEGEEVKLYWANRDQYYIKTNEYLRDYTFTLRPSVVKDPMRVHFRLADAAEGEHGNAKVAEGKGRVFVLPSDDFVAEENGDLVLRFHYRPATMDDWSEEARQAATVAAEKKPPVQKELLADAVRRVLAAADPVLKPWIDELSKKHVKANGETSDCSRLEGHLNRYCARHTFDYFIHKDLGGFLHRELDFFIKNEIMHLDDVESERAPRVEQYLSKIKAIRKIAHKLIGFLAQLEDFQKKLWLKKRFVVETNFCITLDRVPEELYPDVASNGAQREEWIQLFAIDVIKKDLAGAVAYSSPLTVEFLKANPYLVLDTKFFSSRFRKRLLATVDELDAAIDGLLVHSDSFHALRLLQAQFSSSIDCAVIDPPYNTGSDGFTYKDTYPHSTWLSMMFDRLKETKSLLSEDGLVAINIDDNELCRLGLLLHDLLGERCLAACAPWKSEASGGKEKTGLRTGHEYLLIYHNGSASHISQEEKSTGELDRVDKFGRYRKGRELRKWGGVSLRSDRPGQWYCLKTRNDEEVWPIRNDGREGHWRWGQNNKHIRAAMRDPEVFHWAKCSFDQGVTWNGHTDRWVPFEKIRTTKKAVGWTTWLDRHGTNADATRVLKDMFGEKPFDTPKPTSLYEWFLSLHDNEDGWVIDFTGGSGTTGHAVINLNRDQDARKKYILVETGTFFDTVLLPRIKMAIYSSEWKDRKPVSREGSSQMFKYMRLESYEDTLNNLDTRRSQAQASLLDAAEAGGADSLKEEYLLRYMLDVETRGSRSLLNVAAFIDPTAYRLKVKVPGSDESREVNVDLLETFNYLIGLTVKHIAVPQTFQAAFTRGRGVASAPRRQAEAR